jgi:hypothetical protein
MTNRKCLIAVIGTFSAVITATEQYPRATAFSSSRSTEVRLPSGKDKPLVSNSRSLIYSQCFEWLEETELHP